MSAEEWSAALRLLRGASFWDLPAKEDYQSGTDGSSEILEASINGRYQVIDRWAPWHDSSKRHLEGFVSAGQFLLKIANVDLSRPP